MRLFVIPMLLAATMPVMAIAQKAPAQSTPDETSDVVVTGVRLSDTERALQECLARKCPVDQDIAATLAHAENLFVAGSYEAARSVLRASRGRNKRFAAQFPLQVATLARATSRVASHLGYNDELKLSAIDSIDALKAGLPAKDWHVIGGRIEVADAFAQVGRIQAAEDMYRAIADEARKLGLPAIEGYARLRIVALYDAYAQSDPGTYAGEARLAAKQLSEAPDPALKPFARAASLIVARQQSRFGDLRPLDRLIARYGDDVKTERPVIIYSPSIPFLNDILPRAEGGDALRGLSQAVVGQWIDVGFSVLADGHVGEVMVLRKSPELARTDWSQLVMSAIKRRRYLPLKRDPGADGIQRVERYTLTSAIDGVASLTQNEDFRIKGRYRSVSDIPYIRAIDLSIDAEPTKAPAKDGKDAVPLGSI